MDTQSMRDLDAFPRNTILVYISRRVVYLPHKNLVLFGGIGGVDDGGGISTEVSGGIQVLGNYI
jgi:hypothetical protein